MDEVDAQVSTWNAVSDLMRINATPVGECVAAPARLFKVLRIGLESGRAVGGDLTSPGRRGSARGCRVERHPRGLACCRFRGQQVKLA